jgi:hypothetical protein
MSIVAEAGIYFGNLFVGTLRAGSIWLDVPDSVPCPLDAWTHVVCTYGPVYTRLYIDGALHVEALNAGLDIMAENPTEPFVLGAGKNPPGGGGAYYASLRGGFDEVGFWSKELSSGEVTDLYNGGSGLSY